MKAENKIIIGIFILLILAGFAKFFNNNVIIPEPYQPELRICLDRASGDDAERDRCFRQYPHFN